MIGVLDTFEGLRLLLCWQDAAGECVHVITDYHGSLALCEKVTRVLRVYDVLGRAE